MATRIDSLASDHLVSQWISFNFSIYSFFIFSFLFVWMLFSFFACLTVSLSFCLSACVYVCLSVCRFPCLPAYSVCTCLLSYLTVCQPASSCLSTYPLVCLPNLNICLWYIHGHSTDVDKWDRGIWGMIYSHIPCLVQQSWPYPLFFSFF